VIPATVEEERRAGVVVAEALYYCNQDLMIPSLVTLESLTLE
jgi:hypothetical protein